MRQVMLETEAHRRRSAMTSFYSLTRSSYLVLCQCVYQMCMCLATEDMTVRPILDLFICFYSLLYMIYYGVEHFIAVAPTRLEDVPRYALHLSFTKGLHRLGHVFAREQKPVAPNRVHSFTIPSAANTITIEYCIAEDTTDYNGPLFSTQRRHVLQCKIIVDEYGLLPVTTRETSQAYLHERNIDQERRDRARVLTFPAANQPEGVKGWIQRQTSEVTRGS